MRNPMYKWFINGKEIQPRYKSDLNKDYEKESSQRFFRAKLSSKITLVGVDFDLINNSYFDTEFNLVVKKKDKNEDYIDYYKSTFMKTDCTFDLDRKSVAIQVKTTDQYNNVLASLEKEYNILSLAPAIERVSLYMRPITQIYIRGTNSLTNYVAGSIWEQTTEKEIDNHNDLVRNYYFTHNGSFTEWYTEVVENISIDEVLGVYTMTDQIIGEATNPDYYNYKLTVTSEVVNEQFQYYIYRANIKRVSDGVELYKGETLSTANNWNRNRSLTLNGLNGETGVIRISAIVRDIYARNLLNVSTITDSEGTKNTYDIPNDDIVARNRNYRKCIGYRINTSRNTIFIYGGSSIEPTEYGMRDDQRYFRELRFPASAGIGRMLPISPSKWINASFWYLPSWYEEFYELDDAYRYELKSCMKLSSVIQVLLKQIDSTITHEDSIEYSEFLYSDNNPISYQKVDYLLTQKSNVLAGDGGKQALRGVLTLRDILNMLRDCFCCYWFIDEQNRFRIEHVKWFKNGGSYSWNKQIGADVTNMMNTRTGKKWVYGTNNWEFDKEEMTEIFTFAWMDKVSRVFNGFNIEVISKYIQQGKKEEINVSKFSTDVDYILADPSEISQDGFVILGCTKNTNLIYLNDYNTEYEKEILEGGFIVDNNMMNVTGYINVNGGDVYQYLFVVSVVWYDSNKEYIAMNSVFKPSEVMNAKAPDNAKYARLNILRFNWDSETYMKNTIRNLPIVSREFDEFTVRNQNGYLTWLNLHANYWTYDLPAKSVKINGGLWPSYNIETKQLKKQKIEFPSFDDIDTNKLVKTGIGDGTIDKISINLSTRIVTANLKYDAE